METTKKPLGRYIQRLLPIINTCKAHLEDIDKCVRSTLDNMQSIKDCSTSLEPNAKPITFSCIFKASNNASISREDIFKVAGAYFHSKNSANKVDFDKPDFVLLIQIICNMCFISFVGKYFEYKKYNFIEQGSKFNAASSSSTTNKINVIKAKEDTNVSDKDTEVNELIEIKE